MTADTGADDDATAGDERTASPSPGSEEAGVDAGVAELREELESLRTRIDEKTVHRDDIREELRRYVRQRQRRGHATGWGPYLVLLYGTAMTIGAFYYLNNWAAVAAMLVVWLSTLGLYVVMVVMGSFFAAGRKAVGAVDLVRKLR